MIRKSLKYGIKYCAVEHADNHQFFFLQLKRKQKELVVSNKGEATDFESLLQKIEGQKHLFLTINNEQVLTKKAENTQTTDERLVKAAFPNIALSDFYYNVYSNGSDSFISISRKEYVNNIINQYAAKKISVIDFSLGSLSIETLTNFIDQSEITSSNAKVSLEGNSITQIEKQVVSETAYTINDLEISNKHVLPLAGIIHYYTNANSQNEVQKGLQKEYIQKRFFDLGFKAALGILFVSLLVNFLIFSNYQGKEVVYKAELLMNEAKKKELTNLKELVSRKKKLAQSISSSANSRVTWYFDEISAVVPKTISLSNMSYQPLERSLKENKKTYFKDKTIQISGISNNDEDVNAWITLLEKKDWINEVSIVKYGRGKKTKNAFDFKITLNE